MFWKTHLAMGLAAALYFSNYVSKPLLFIPVVLIASLFPDIDSGFSILGRKPVFKPIQMTTEHRGIIHSYTMAIFLSLVIAFFYPVLALPFFLGYSFHLFLDSFTPQGIKPFWPIKSVSSGSIRAGGKLDKTIFYTLIVVDIILAGSMLYGLL